MKKAEIKDIIRGAIKPRMLCGVLFGFAQNFRYYFPLKVSDKLFLAANDDDFLINGFSVMRFRDAKKAKINNYKYMNIMNAEGILDKIEVPDIDVTDWHSVFESLSKLYLVITVEKESLDED